MSIRLRRIDGLLVALCAVEADPVDGDVYLDDEVHEALAAKFANDWSDHIPWTDAPRVTAMESAKVRDAAEDCAAWARARGGVAP